MSVSMWSYRPEVCDGEGCPGDCDLCEKPKNMEDEDDMTDYIKREDGFYQPKDYKGCRNCKHQPEPLRMCEYGENRNFIEIICSKWEKKDD